MKTLVIDVAADSGGALSILNQYYDEFSKDTENEYVFCVSLNSLKETNNMTIEELHWVKKSWLHRLWFDYIYSHKLIKKYKVDNVFSLQNTLVPMTKIPQTLYLHQSLPFCDYKFKFSENKKFWVYQNLIGKLIHKSVKRANKVIVQTQWMKDAVLAIDKIEESKIEILPPEIKINVVNFFDMSRFTKTFFYPASNYIYKNHKVLLEAALKLKEQNINDFNIIFTLTNENLPKDCREIYNKVKENIELVGSITHDEVMNYYSKSVLVFPSYIETFGLPLLEAKESKSPIIASDMPFSREILDEYDKVSYFDAFSSEELSELLKKYCNWER
ncbi:MAG: glycosyltransferase [Oscillospiraceae bacterium]